MTRKTKHQKRRHWGRRIVLTLVVLAAICGLAVAFFPQLNNTVRTATGNDTAADTAVKNTLVSKLQQQKTGNPVTDAIIDKTATTLRNTKMATLMKAAADQNTAASILTKAGIPSTTAQAITTTIYSDSQFDALRQKLAAGDYYGVYQAANDLKHAGVSTSQLQSALQQ